MPANFIKLFFIFFHTIIICSKLMNFRITIKFHKFMLMILILTLTCFSHFLKLYIPALTYTVPFLLLWISLAVFTMRPQVAFIATSISFGISYSLLALSSFLILVIVFPMHLNPTTFPYNILAILAVIVQTLFIFILVKTKRFAKGMPFLFSTTFINSATIICVIFIGFLMYIQATHIYLFTQVLTLLLFIFTLAFLIFWWQAQLTKSYKRALQLRELESLRLELQEKDKLITSLTTQNEQLGKLIHRDNKLIPAMNNAVCEYLISDTNASQTMKTKGDSLLTELRQLSENRTNILSEIYANKYKSYETGVTALDTLLNYMEKRASQEDIHLAVHIALDLKDYIPHIITSGDLVHLLSDLLENAFIATNHCMTRNIQLQFYVSQKVFIIEVADNGIPFEGISLINLGITKMTTHADTGGSGIGLMDIWEIKEKYGASLHITEYENATPYSKKIAFLFNRKNRYSVSTWRKDDLLQASKRTDLQVYTHEND